MISAKSQSRETSGTVGKRAWSRIVSMKIALFCAVGVLIFCCCIFLIRDARERRSRWLQTELPETVGFRCAGTEEEETVGITGDGDDGFWDVYLPGEIITAGDKGEPRCVTDDDGAYGDFVTDDDGDNSGGDEGAGRVMLSCDRRAFLRIGGRIYRDGDVLPAFAAGEEIPAVIGDRYGRAESGTFRFYEVSGLPSIFLTLMENNAEQEMEETKGQDESAVAAAADGSGIIVFRDVCRIRVHGNTTWFANKKSYNLHFGEPVSLYDMGAQKKWVLIGNQADASNLENAVMQTFAARIGENFCPEWRYVNVFLNGEYKGLYLLIQKIDISGGTVQIANLEKENEETEESKNSAREDAADSSGTENRAEEVGMDDVTDSPDITGGYLMELMGKGSWDVALRKFETTNRYVEVKSPKNATAEEINYIAGVTEEAEKKLYGGQKAEDAVVDDGGAQAGGIGKVTDTAGEDESGAGKSSSWLEDFDERSWIIQFILQEVSFNSDTELGSQFFYKEAGDPKLYGGPGWDFDKSLLLPTANEGTTYLVRSLHVDGLHDDGKVQGGKLWLQQMDSDPVFHKDMKQFFLQTAGPSMEQIVSEDIPRWREEIRMSVQADCIRWGKDFEAEQKAEDRVTKVFMDRVAFLEEYYAEEESYVVVRFRIQDGRYDLLVPVLRGDSLGEEVLPLVEGSMDWVQENGEPFTSETVVTENMTVHVG